LKLKEEENLIDYFARSESIRDSAVIHHGGRKSYIK